MWDFFKDKLGRVLGAILGFAGIGILGGLIGFAIGYLIDKLHLEGSFLWGESNSSSEDGGSTDFILSTLVLAAAVVKSDGSEDEMEVSYISRFLTDQFGSDNIHEYMNIFQKAVTQPWDIRKVTQQIRQNNSYETRLQILYLLFGIANADYNIDEKEIANIKIISIHLGISINDHDSIKAMFYNEMDAYYKILDLLPSASDVEVKESYRKMAMKYHPDKIAHLGPAVMQLAQEKFQKVQQAFDVIKDARGFK